ncbi:MAG: sigma 54-interacting transcriptional regulator, partial [Chthoniobacteraceae bacterium]
GDLSASTQVKLLRVLQERSIQRLGGRDTIPVDARIITATHRDLEQEIAEGKFREDLFYRLNVACINIPPLRERSEDIPELVRFFLRRHGAELEVLTPAIEPTAVELLEANRWPGNVRELQNVIRKALLAARGYPITREIVSAVLRTPAKREQNSGALAGYIAELLAAARIGELENIHSVVHDAVDRELMSQAIRLAGGNQAEAARWLGISRLTLRAKLRALGLHPSQQMDRKSDFELPTEDEAV